MAKSGPKKSNSRTDEQHKPLIVSVLRQRRDFMHVQHKGIRQVMSHFILQAVMARPSSQASPFKEPLFNPAVSHRIGVTASKKVGNAVARNRAKRRMRALFRLLHPLHIPSGTDYVLIARHSLVRAGWTELTEDFSKAVKHIDKKLNANAL
jgi:ribonuclease P protein component